MIERLAWLLLSSALALALALTGCADSRTADGTSETHFLLLCSDESCGPGLSCDCGVCSKPCETDAMCTPLADGARCLSVGHAACSSALRCDVQCTSDGDCTSLGSGYKCDGGRCRATHASKPPGSADASEPPGSADASEPPGSADASEPPLSTDPGLAYGPCSNNPKCGGGNGGLAEQSSDGACICVVFCEPNDRCPQPATGDVTAECVSFGDVVQNGHSGKCDLPCTTAQHCPDGSQCSNGMCRFGITAAMCSGPACGNVTPPTPITLSVPNCDPPAITSLLAGTSPLVDCGNLDTSTAQPSAMQLADAVRCVSDALAAKNSFSFQWGGSFIDSAFGQGYVGTLGDDGTVQVQGWRFDFGMGFIDVESRWSPCASFRVHEDCSTIEDCFQCELRTAQECTCGFPGNQSVPVATCRTNSSDPAGAIASPPCPTGSCNMMGVCYPNGTTSEDGCCTCDAQGGSCIEPGWCPGWVNVGKRCSNDGDCSRGGAGSGLFCRTDFFGERGVCTRDCNFGCPTGLECVPDVPDYNGGTIHNVCMRPCSTAGDCSVNSTGDLLGSECDAPGTSSSTYCF